MQVSQINFSNNLDIHNVQFQKKVTDKKGSTLTANSKNYSDGYKVGMLTGMLLAAMVLPGCGKKQDTQAENSPFKNAVIETVYDKDGNIEETNVEGYIPNSKAATPTPNDDVLSL